MNGHTIDDAFPAAEVVASIAGLPPLKWVVRVHPCCPECSASMWISREENGGTEVWCDGCGHTFHTAGTAPELVGAAVVRAVAQEIKPIEPSASPDLPGM